MNPPLSLVKGERIEVRGFPDKVNKWNPHPPLSLLKGEAKTSHGGDHVKSNDDC